MDSPQHDREALAVTEDAYDDNEIIQTQPQTQSQTQPSTQPIGPDEQYLWGYLMPCSTKILRIDFFKLRPRYTIGRDNASNAVVLPGVKISNKHCTITWDGEDSIDACITVLDTSSNGTWINGKKVGRGQTCILRDGQEIGFGTAQQRKEEDYRFIYRHTAGGRPTVGLYAFYDVHNELGKGSFATVMKAISRTTGEWYAVKMIHEGKRTHGDGGTIAREKAYAREIAIMEQLKHPNIVRFKEAFMEKQSINLVLELVEGGDLLDYILKHDGLSEDSTKRIAYQMCAALGYIHSQGVAHRDLKPENVLLTKDDPPVVKIADFGLAKVASSETMLRTMCGTPSYLAPEVVRKELHESYDNLVDSWSVGVIVFCMLTNTNPFIEDEEQRDIRTRISERRVDWDTLERKCVSNYAKSFIQCLLQEDPKRRMTLANSLQHPWFEGVDAPGVNGSATPIAGPSNTSNFSYSSLDSGAAEDLSMISVPGLTEQPDPSRRFQQLNLQSVASSEGSFEVDPPADSQDSLFPRSNAGDSFVVANGGPSRTPSTAAIRREDSRVLQRRSNVLQQAVEEDRAMLQPTPDMVEFEQARKREQEKASAAPMANAEAGPSAPTQARPNKRAHSELTPLSEEMGAESGSGSGDSSDTILSPKKKGRAATKKPAAKKAPPKSKKASGDDGPVVPPRRSGRTHKQV